MTGTHDYNQLTIPPSSLSFLGSQTEKFPVKETSGINESTREISL
jgi:hypothetical protein